MFKVLGVCCVGISLLSGCGVALENGKWRPMGGDEYVNSFYLNEINRVAGYCNMVASNTLRDECIEKEVEPRLYTLEANKERISKNEISLKEEMATETPISSGPFDTLVPVNSENSFPSSVTTTRIAVVPLTVSLEF